MAACAHHGNEPDRKSLKGRLSKCGAAADTCSRIAAATIDRKSRPAAVLAASPPAQAEHSMGQDRRDNPWERIASRLDEAYDDARSRAGSAASADRLIELLADARRDVRAR